MSYDLEIWSVRPFEPASMPKGTGVTSAGRDYAVLGCGWQIVINSSDKMLPEDLPDEVAAALPGIRYLTELNLEGKATHRTRTVLQSTANKIAQRMHGVVLDPQRDLIITPSGVTRLLCAKTEKTFSVINLTWWFLGDALLSKGGRIAFLELLQKLLPEALPKRYGEYEPPQHLFSETGLKHLERFMGRHLDDGMVWYPQRPVTGVEISCPEPPGWSERGFRTNLVEIQIELSALKEPGWAEHLRHFWREMTFLLKPIYGEVRTEGGYTRSGGIVWVSADAIPKSYPFTNRSFFWRGIPRRLGSAVVLGEEYQKLWPNFLKGASQEKGFAFASVPDWSGKMDVIKVSGSAPEAISLLPGEGMGPKQKYPPVWPFSRAPNVFGLATRERSVDSGKR